MILVDTSVWIEHLRHGNGVLQGLLESNAVVTHPLVRLELALASITNREIVLADLALLPSAPVAQGDELFDLIDVHRLRLSGAGITDVHLVASALLDHSVSIWTRDRRLREIAYELGLSAGIE